MLLVAHLLALAVPQTAAPPQRIEIRAEVDGVDELHLGAREARLEHEAFDLPRSVTIGGREWDPRLDRRLAAREGEPFFDPELDLAGARVLLRSGRGAVSFRHGEEALVIRFDDSRGGGAGVYEVVIDFAETLCAAGQPLGDPDPEALECASELLLEARVDGVDELHLGPTRADWLHLAWAWPEDVRLGEAAWDPEAAPLEPAAGCAFFPPDLDLARVELELLRGRGEASLEVGGERLFVRIDDGEAAGADDYALRLRFPLRKRRLARRLPSGAPHRVELRHAPAEEVAGARVTVLARSPRTEEWLPWPGQVGMAADGRCVLALPDGEYRFEVLHAPAPGRLVALRTAATRIRKDVAIELDAARAAQLEWRDAGEPLELRELAIQSLAGEGEVAWRWSSDAPTLALVASPSVELDLRAFGLRGGQRVAWWTRRSFGSELRLESSSQRWTRCRFVGAGDALLPTDCEVELRAPASSWSFPVEPGTELWTNRRFLSLAYEHALQGGGRARFHPRELELPKPGGTERVELGGELVARGSALVLADEHLGSAEDLRLWWQLELRDAAGSVLDTANSDVDWEARVVMVDGSLPPLPPLDEEGLALLGDPVASVRLEGSYRWNGEARQVDVVPEPERPLQDERFRTRVPGHLESRAEAYLQKARLTYRHIGVARGLPGDHGEPIELKWWLNDGAVGAWGSITMPLQGMTEDFDRFSFPWALAHESLHAFGYHHGPELERLDLAAIALFERWRWRAEWEPGFLPPAR